MAVSIFFCQRSDKLFPQDNRYIFKDGGSWIWDLQVILVFQNSQNEHQNNPGDVINHHINSFSTGDCHDVDIIYYMEMLSMLLALREGNPPVAGALMFFLISA